VRPTRPFLVVWQKIQVLFSATWRIEDARYTMTLLNPGTIGDPMYNATRALCIAVIEKHGKVSVDFLLKTMMPKIVFGEEKQQLAAWYKKWVSWGLFSPDASKVRFSDEVLGEFKKLKKSPDDIDCALRHLIFAQVNEQNLEDTEGTEGSTTADFCRTLTWLLAVDGVPNADWEREWIRIMFNAPNDGWGFNKESWDYGMTRWPHYLGFCVNHGSAPDKVQVPDPTVAISEHLSRIFRGDTELAHDVFIHRLGQELPVLDGGWIRKRMESRMAEKGLWVPPDQGTVSASTSRALLRLQHRREISLIHADDSERTFLTTTVNGKCTRSGQGKNHDFSRVKLVMA
jgi:hypothetical protein